MFWTFDLWTFASGQNSGFPRIQGWEEPLNGRHRQLTAGLSTPYLFYPRFPSLLRRDRQRVGHWRVENCANPGEQVAGSTRAGVPANRGVITYTLSTQRTEIREPHCPISEHWRGHLSRFTQIELAGAREPLDSALCASSVFPQVKSTFVYLFHWLNPLMSSVLAGAGERTLQIKMVTIL